MKKFAILTFLIIALISDVAFADDNKQNLEKEITEYGYVYSPKGFATAISSGDYYIVAAFIESGYDVNQKISGIPPTFYAILKQQQSSLEKLLQSGANPDETWGKLSLLNYAISTGNSYLVDILIQNNADVNKDAFGIRPLNYALMKKHVDIAKKLSENGALPDKTSLKYAKKTKNEEIIKIIQDSYDTNYNFFK